MATQIIKDGRQIANPLNGIDNYDLKRLTADQAVKLQGIIQKTRANTRLTPDDINALGAIRRAAKVSKSSAPSNESSMDKALRLASELKQVLK